MYNAVYKIDSMYKKIIYKIITDPCIVYYLFMFLLILLVQVYADGGDPLPPYPDPSGGP